MNKKFILPISLMLLVGLAVFVSASMTSTSSDPLSNKQDYNVELSLEKGWNLVVGVPVWGDESAISSNSEIKLSDIKASFYYFRYENKYIQFFPNSQEIENYLRNAQEKPDEALYFAQSPVWIYSNKAGVLRYTREDFPKYDSSNKVTLSSCWNFITITPNMEGKTFEDVQGNCNVEKAYLYYSEAGNWRSVERNRDIFGSQNFLDIGQGMLIKVTNSCQMGETETSVNLPVMP